MATEARFICELKQVIDESSVQLILRASIKGRDNTEWAPYTPAGQLSMVVTGPAAAEFVQDGRYRLLIEAVPDGE